MRILVCGDRNWTSLQLIERALRAEVEIGGLGDMAGSIIDLEPLTLIHGMAKGADTLGEIAAHNIYSICGDVNEILRFPAQWGKYGKAAGPKRNQQMLDEGKPELVLAFHADIEHSKGTKDMVSRARKAGIPVKIITGVD